MTIKIPIEEMIQKYLGGMSSYKLGIEYGCDGETILNRLKANNIEIKSMSGYDNPRYIADLPIDDIINHYNNGISVQKLARMYNVDRATIQSRLISCGIEIRSRREAAEIRWDDPEECRKNSIRRLDYYENPDNREKTSIGVLNAHINDPTLGERLSAGHQHQDYDAGEWIGYTEKERPHLKPAYKCIHLNPEFEGCERHHIMTGVVINIPYDIHRHLSHRFPKADEAGKNMEEINNIAFKYLLGNLN